MKYKKYLLGAGILIIILLIISGRLFSKNESETEEAPVANEELLILGTAETIQGLSAHQVYTDKGVYEYDDKLDFSPYIFQSVQVVTEEQVILYLNNPLKRQVTLKNRLITGFDQEGLHMFSDGYEVRLPCSELSGTFDKVVADIDLTNGMVSKLSVKKDSIKGKLLSVRADAIEVEGYGLLPLSDAFRFYETYGELKEKSAKELIVGFDQAELIVAKGEVCAAILTEALTVEKIRVLLKTTEFAEIIHPSVTLAAHGAYHYHSASQEGTLNDGEELTLTPGCELLSGGRLIFTPESEENQLEIKSIQRNQGTPSYYGSLECVEDSGGIVLVNELNLETYLYGVVPSEMPASYEMEALKAQAICARSYAFRQIMENGYAQYGAHVDDSVTYQVYNNLPADEKVREAVDSTGGKVLKFAGEVAATYYYSTSCGYSTSETIWENGSPEHSYLQGKLLNDSREKLNLEDEGTFRQFITNEEYETCDSGEAWYRWELTVPLDQLSAHVNQIQNIGTIESIQVELRNEGGAVQQVKVSGTGGEATLKTEYVIRKALNGEGVTITRRHGADAVGGKLLPSGFFVVDPVMDGNKLTGFHFQGGGFGHGAGMSQNGANHMAQAGKSCEEILDLFYEGAVLGEMADE